MALTRARPVFGSVEARSAVASIVHGVLEGDRPARDVIADAGTMRSEMAAHKPPKGPLDAKLLPGGLVDLEFAIHVVQLVNRAGFDPNLGIAIDALIRLGLVPPSLREAHDVLTRLLVTLRLVAPDAAPPGHATEDLIARAIGVSDWAAVVATLDSTRQEVRQFWAQVTGEQHG